MKAKLFLSLKTLKKWVPSLILGLSLAACGGGKSSISVKPSVDSFEQHDITDVDIDILFMIDDSGSMSPAQQAMRDNLYHFIELFNNKGFDFRVAVGKTSEYGKSNPNFFAASHGKRILGSVEAQQQSYDLIDLFEETVIAVGIGGSGTEKGIESVQKILESQASAQNFPRPGAHLAVIYIGDEDDQSGGTVVSWFNQLQSLVNSRQVGGSVGGLSTHAIQVTGQPNCQASSGYYGGSSSYGTIHSAATAGTRFFEMAGLSFGGMSLSICSNFGDSLSDLGDNIASLASAFPLNDVLDQNGIDTLQVYVEGLNGNNPIPKNSSNGYTYDAPTNSIIFHGSMIPPQGAVIGVNYTCATLNCN